MSWMVHFCFWKSVSHVCLFPVPLTELMAHSQQLEVQGVQTQLQQLSTGWAAKLVPGSGAYSCWKPSETDEQHLFPILPQQA